MSLIFNPLTGGFDIDKTTGATGTDGWSRNQLMMPLAILLNSPSSSSSSNFVGIKYNITITSTNWELRDTGSVNYSVDWGDGNTQSSTSNNLSHTYATTGSYVVTLTPTGTYSPYWSNNSAGNNITSIEIGTDSSWNLGTNLTRAFWGVNMTSFTINPSATANVTTMLDIFKSTDLVEMPSLDYSSVTGMQGAFAFCSSLTTFPANQFDNSPLGNNAMLFTFLLCALTAQSIENILTSLDTGGVSNNQIWLQGGTNAAKTTWSTAANTAYTNLINKGWTISHNA